MHKLGIAMVLLAATGSAHAVRPTNSRVLQYVQRNLASKAVPMTAPQKAAFDRTTGKSLRTVYLFGATIDDRTSIYLPKGAAKSTVKGLPPRTLGIIETHEQFPEYYQLLKMPKAWLK